MKNLKILLVIVSLMLCLSACGDKPAEIDEETGAVMQSMTDIQTDAPEQETESEPASETGSDQTSSEVVEKEKLDRKDFGDLPKAAEQAGYTFRAIETFSNDYRFDSFSMIAAQDKDEAGQKVGEPYQVIGLNYIYKNDVFNVTVTIYPMEGEITPPVTYVSTKEIEGRQVSLTEYMLRMVDKDYQLTDEDRALMEKGNMSFSCDGVTIGDVYFRNAYWQEDGLYYELVSGADMSVEELDAMVAEFLKADYCK